MINVSAIKRLGLRKTYILSTLLLLVIFSAGAVSVRQASLEAEKNKALVLNQLQKEQEELTKKSSVSDDHIDEHKEAQSIEFKDVSDREFQRPTCSRLENRAAIVVTDTSCSYRLRATGTATMAVVFVHDNSYSAAADYNQLTNKDANNPNSLQSVNKYLQAQAKRYKIANLPTIDMKYFGPFQVSEPVSQIYYRENGYKLLEIYKNTAAANKVPEQDYDMVHYVLLNQTYGGIAFPGLHRAFTHNAMTVPTFVHETLHLYGASDKYNNNDCSTIGTNDPFGRYNGSLPGSDIMCSNFSLSSSMINDITAREIGWAN